MRRVCVVTGSRAEYGLLRPLLAHIVASHALELRLVVTGSHLSPAFGETWREIEADGFAIDERVPLPLENDSAIGTCDAMAAALSGLARAFARLAPDVVVLLGDRYEILSAAIAAQVSLVPVAHIHGGEVTEGAFDDAMRHAVTKLAMLHFTSAEVYHRRVVQLGEDPARVFTVGALGLDNIRELPLLSREEFEREFGFTRGKQAVALTFHPVTLAEDSAAQLAEVLAALDDFPETRVVITRPNADPGNRELNERLDAFVASHADRAAAFASLGVRSYLSLLACVDAVVGNSSSGILEAPSLHVPTIDVGDRQKGRVRAGSIIQCEPERKAIAKALRAALSPEFRALAAEVTNPYGDGHAAERIVAVLESAGLGVRKRFFDIDTTPES
jgi:GDP/UDP-N,N'-diacetylbacillosamine 2-epimerase (hydrolysing)